MSGPIVVLGGGGFIGSNLVRRLVDEGLEVHAVDVAFPEWRKPALVGARLRRIDLRDQVAVEEAVGGASLVFHLAADMGGVAWFHSDKDFGSSMANGLITNRVLSACVALEVPRLVYSSSACACATAAQVGVNAAFGGLTENDLHWGTPDARYGAEKRYGAWMCEQAPMDARVAVLHTVYGPLQEHEGQRMKFPAAVATKALDSLASGRLELWGNGEQLRTYLYVDDAVDRLLTLARSPQDPGPIMVGATHDVSCRQVAEICLGIVGSDAEIITVDGPVGVQARGCDLTKWVDHFGTPHETPLLEGFGRFIDWLRSVR